jgi:hypothetical protein
MLIKIKNKISADFGGARKGPLIGDVRQALGEDLQRAIIRAVEDTFKKDYKEYYLFVYCRNYGKDIKTTVMIHKDLPPKLLGTICYRINNLTGDVKRLWVLPMDMPVPDDIRSDEVAPDVMEDGKGMPILYS